MRNHKPELRISVLHLAVQGALAAMIAAPTIGYAADSLQDEVATIRHPTNFVEVGVEGVNKDSAKFGEYNGLKKSGASLIGNFSVRGGDAYEGGDGTLRWGITGSDLGTTSRELGGSVSNQGRWDLNVGYDELRHHITDSYQTPQQGSMGGNSFTLPSNFGAFNAQSSPSARSLNATQLAAFHTEDVSSTRRNTSFGVGYHFNQQLNIRFDYNNLDQSGAKLITAAALGQAATTGTWRAEAVAMLMNPTNYTTDTFNLALNWVGEKGHLSGSYHASLFRNGYDRLSWQNPMLSNASTAAAGLYQTGTLSTAPNNQFHQLNLSGGYAFNPATKLAGGLAYGRNTQDQSFLAGLPEIVLAPTSSLDGRVITKHADLKITNQTTRDLTLSAGFKYNERDNRTASNVYRFYAINNMTTADYAANAPYSNKNRMLELAGDYRIDKRQSVRAAYSNEKVDRWCNQYALSNALSSGCLVDTSNTEDRFGLKYRLKASDGIALNLGYTYGKRKGTYDHNAITPLSGLDTATPSDVNGQNVYGFVAAPYAIRKQDLFKVGLTWQANDKLELNLEGRYGKDRYTESALGLQSGEVSSINIDATYNYSDSASVSAYAGWQTSKRNLRDAANGTSAAATYAAIVAGAPTQIWTTLLDETSNSVGINTKHKLLGGKLELIGDLSYSIDKSGYSTQVPYLATCAAATSLTCVPLPDIKSEVLTFKITGIYDLDKKSKVSIGYLYQKLKSDDYFYNTYQYGYTPNRVMPTNQVAPNYTVNVIAASYIYSFK